MSSRRTCRQLLVVIIFWSPSASPCIQAEVCESIRSIWREHTPYSEETLNRRGVSKGRTQKPPFLRPKKGSVDNFMLFYYVISRGQVEGCEPEQVMFLAFQGFLNRRSAVVDILFRHCPAKNFYVIARSVFNPNVFANFLVLARDFVFGEWVGEFSGNLIC